MENWEAEVIQFYVPGKVTGKPRPRVTRHGVYTPKNGCLYENLVKVKAEEAMQGRVPIDGPVAVTIWLLVVPPASWSQKKQRQALEGVIHPTSKPDIDNVIKGIFDAMNEVVWNDDRQVVEVSVRKLYAGTAAAKVRVSRVL